MIDERFSGEYQCDVCNETLTGERPSYLVYDYRWRIDFDLRKIGAPGYVPDTQRLKASGHRFCSPECLSDWVADNGDKMGYGPLENIAIAE